jgi:segregation and condensation protein B
MFRLSSQIEAILYLKGQPLDLAAIAECAGCDRDAAETATIELMDEYNRRDSALEVVETPTGYTLQLRSSFQTLIDKMIPPEIGTGALRTLAAIAIKGSISQTDLVELRGSGAYQHVQELVEIGFVRKRRQAGNRSSLLQVTDKFHRTYELNDLPIQQLVAPATTEPAAAIQLEIDTMPTAAADSQGEMTTASLQSEQMAHSETATASDLSENENGVDFTTEAD